MCARSTQRRQRDLYKRHFSTYCGLNALEELNKEITSEMRALLLAAVVIAAGYCDASFAPAAATIYANVWAVQVEGGSEEADALAKKYNFINKGQVRGVLYAKI